MCHLRVDSENLQERERRKLAAQESAANPGCAQNPNNKDWPRPGQQVSWGIWWNTSHSRGRIQTGDVNAQSNQSRTGTWPPDCHIPTGPARLAIWRKHTHIESFSIFTFRYWPKTTENMYLHKNVYMDVHSSIIHNSPKWKQSKCPSTN